MSQTISYPVTLTDTRFQWTSSGSGTNEYYLELLGGGDPTFLEPLAVRLDGSALTQGTLGSLGDVEWNYGDNDSLGFSTVYLRYDSSDPDELMWGRLEAVLSEDGVCSLSNPLFYTYERIVRAPEDFFPLDSSVVYRIDGAVDMGSTTIEVPAGGLSVIGSTFDISKLTSSVDNFTLFSSPEGGSGNLLMVDVAIEVTGSSSQVFDLTDATGFNAFEFSRVNFNGCTSLGTVTNYRQGLETGTGRFGGTPNLTLAGTWVGGYRITTSIVRSLSAGMSGALFQAGAGFSMASRFLSDINCDLPASASFADFSPSNFVNPSTLQINGGVFSRNGSFDSTDANIFPNITKADLASSFKNNKGIRNTFVGGRVTVSTEIETSIPVSGTFYFLDATWTASSLEHFDSPANGQLRHLGDNPLEYTFIADLLVDGGNNDDLEVRVRKYDASTTTTSTVRSQRRQVNNFTGGRDVAFFTILEDVELNTNDYIFLEVANNTDTTNVTVELDSFLMIREK